MLLNTYKNIFGNLLRDTIMEEKNLFTTKVAAKYLGISSSTIYRMEKRGLISSIRTPGGQRRFNKENVNTNNQLLK